MALLIIKFEDHFGTEGYERKGCERGKKKVCAR